MAITIVFPENVRVNKEGRIIYTSDEPIDPLKYDINIITINGIDYSFTYLNDTPGNKGGNSMILKLYETQTLSVDEYPEYGNPDLILKINKRPKRKHLDASNRRFLNEVEALLRCRQHNFENIVKIYDQGYANIGQQSYLCYTMEYADQDLKSFIENHHSTLSFEDKISLCISIARGVNELFSLGVYHRDLKPDNIFIAQDSGWKIGDLGLVSGAGGVREFIRDLDRVNEFVGPRGWISPEVMNKFLTEEKGFRFHYDCVIDHQSDIYQLGKMFWYIFQHNSPIGYLKYRDFLGEDVRLFYLIRSMLYHSKQLRVRQISEVISVLEKIQISLLKATG